MSLKVQEHENLVAVFIRILLDHETFSYLNRFLIEYSRTPQMPKQSWLNHDPLQSVLEHPHLNVALQNMLVTVTGISSRSS